MQNINPFDEAKKIASIADQSQFDSNNWTIRNTILYQMREPALWSHICFGAELICKKPILKIWLLIEHVNGWRRQFGKWDIEYAVSMLDEIKQQINRLSDGPVKNRLLEIWAYHCGWVYQPAGEFQKASQGHEISLRLATSEFGRVIANHNMTMELLNAAIVKNDREKITSAFTKFQEANNQALAFFTDNPSGAENIRWWINISYHHMWYRWLLGETSPALETLKRADNMLAELKMDKDAASAVLKMLYDYCQGDYEKVVQTKIGDTTKEKDWFHYAAIVRALALVKLQKIDGAKKQIEHMFALQNTEHGGHLAYAIVENGIIPELAQFAPK